MRAMLPAYRIAEFLLLFAATLLYLLTLDNGLQPYELGGGDLITHHYAQVQARFANAPGYPLYSMGGWLWFHSLHALITALGSTHPNPIPILSSYSTLWAIPALWLFYRLILRYTTSPQRRNGNWPVAWLLSAFFGATYFFWYYATTSEQYSSAVAQTLAILYVYGVWSDKAAANPAPRRDDSEGNREWSHSHAAHGRHTNRGDNPWLYLLAFLCGLSLAHMLTVAFIVPPLVAVLLHQAPYLLRSPVAIAKAVLAAMLPLAGYLFVYVRGAQFPEWRGAGEWESTAAWFWDFVGTDQGRDELSWGLDPNAPFFGNGFPEIIWQELSIPLLLLGVVGIAFLPRRAMLILYGTLVIYLGFCWAYRLGNWFQVIIPAYPLVLLGVAAFIHRVEQHAPGTRAGSTAFPRAPVQTVAVLALIIVLVWRVDASLPDADSRNRLGDTALDNAAILIDQPLPEHAALFSPVEDALALQYLTQIWRIRPDLSVTSSDRALQVLQTGRPLLATWEATPLLLQEMAAPEPIALHALSPDWYLLQPQAAGAHTTVPVVDQNSASTTLGQTEAETSTGNLNPVRRALYGPIILYAYRVAPAPTGAPVEQSTPKGIDLTLYWQLESAENGPAWESSLGISVRPLGPNGYIPRLPVQENGVDADPFVKIDRTMPAPLLIANQDESPFAAVPYRLHMGAEPDVVVTIADPYRFGVAPELLGEIEGFELILYRVRNREFENLAVEQFPLELVSTR